MAAILRFMHVVPIGVAVISLALAVWRASALWQRTISTAAFSETMARLIVAGNVERAAKLCQAIPKGIIARASLACLEQELAFGTDKPATRPQQLKFAFDGAIARELRAVARLAPWAWLAIGGAATAVGLVVRDPDANRIATIIVSAIATLFAGYSIRSHRRIQSGCVRSQQVVLAALLDPQSSQAPTKKTSRPVARMTQRALALGVLGLIASTALPLFARGVGACSGYQSSVFETLNNCPTVTKVLGQQVAPAWTGYACGSTETSASSGMASWRVPISGSKANGVLRFAAQRNRGDWKVTDAQVQVGDVTIDAISCLAQSPLGSSSPIAQELIADCDQNRKAAACFSLSKLYETGTSVAKDPIKTKQYRNKACELGFPVACGRGTPH